MGSMELASSGPDGMDDVSVSIRKIENGYIFHRSWTEGEGEKRKYCDEDFFLPELPEALSGLFDKGSMKDAKGKLWGELKGEALEGDESEDDED